VYTFITGKHRSERAKEHAEEEAAHQEALAANNNH